MLEHVCAFYVLNVLLFFDCGLRGVGIMVKVVSWCFRFYIASDYGFVVLICDLFGGVACWVGSFRCCLRLWCLPVGCLDVYVLVRFASGAGLRDEWLGVFMRLCFGYGIVFRLRVVRCRV